MIGNVILDRYRIEKQLGEGGFGAVYQAQDVKLGRMVALKILNHIAQKNPEHTRRFIDEAKVTSQLSHRNIPVVYEYGQSEEGQLFIVTELFIGGSLEEILGCISLSPRQASWITSEVNEALVAAHQQGITHRDVKPPNIYLHRSTSGEEVKLLDFGIAKLNNHESHTLTGQLFGTPYFMSPEQILGRRDITPAADLYSLGAVLFYNLTSTVPFDGDSQFVIFNKHVNAPVPKLSDRVPHLNSYRLQQLIEVLMEKNPKDRPQSASEAREIFAEIDQITGQIDPVDRQTLLDQWEYSTAREFPPTAAVPPIIDTKLFEAIETPIDLVPIDQLGAFHPTNALIKTDDIQLDQFHLAKEVTDAPVRDHDEWKPTAKLELRAINDALIDADDTTDNLNFSRRGREHSRSSASLSQPPSHPSNPLYISPSTAVDQKISSPPEPSFGPHPPAKSREEVTQLYSGDGLIAARLSWRKLTMIGIAGSVFCIGLMISLNWTDPVLPQNFGAQTQPLDLNQTSPGESDLSADIEITPPLTFPSELPSPRVEVKTPASDEPRLRAPRSKASQSRPIKTTRKSSPTTQRHKRKRVISKSSRGVSKRIRPSKSISPSQSKGQKSVSDAARSKIAIKVRVNPKLQNGSSYDPGDLVTLTSAVYEGKRRVRNIGIRYEVSTRKNGKYLKLKKNKLRLKRTQYVRACTRQPPKTCSSVIRLFVFDSSQTADDLLP